MKYNQTRMPEVMKVLTNFLFTGWDGADDTCHKSDAAGRCVEGGV